MVLMDFYDESLLMLSPICHQRLETPSIFGIFIVKTKLFTRKEIETPSIYPIGIQGVITDVNLPPQVSRRLCLYRGITA
jgi:hypothetical protein